MTTKAPKRKPRPDGWETSVPVVLYNEHTRQMESVAVKFQVDWHKLARELGGRAARNLSGRSALIAGAIVVNAQFKAKDPVK
jgi:hypothetical protein